MIDILYKSLQEVACVLISSRRVVLCFEIDENKYELKNYTSFETIV